MNSPRNELEKSPGEAAPFASRYTTGQELQFFSNGQLHTTGYITDFDPTGEKWGDRSPNHWHVVVRDPETDMWYPAAIWEPWPVKLKDHIKREHRQAEERNSFGFYGQESLAFSVAEMVARVGQIADSTTMVVIPLPTD